MTNDEVWKPIIGYEGLYEVSNLGNVRSLNYYRVVGKIKLLKLYNYEGYRRVKLYKDGRCKTLIVHRLVAQSFIPNPNNHPTVNHKDENKSNNNVNNLEWCTSKYNNNYGNRNSKIASSQFKQVYQLDINGKIIKLWESIMETKEHGFNSSCIVNCCKGRYKTHKGYIWRYSIDETK